MGKVKYTTLQTYLYFKWISENICEICKKVMLHFNFNGTFVNKQSGFRKDSSTNTNMIWHDTVELL
jgi:hypothetical protein